ncbi:hypothetical protein BZG36_01443 [Bifiguratus adelaidae]|uniref:Origin recognition complex subunit 4 n=1 Tax=Bifiguratus adelaidae TaxID=1938954 RepID=A0A261Y4Y2_9FUNG|nr:hypothetical protein BZG36_01443 [Bifiguratus adelaidae]
MPAIAQLPDDIASDVRLVKKHLLQRVGEAILPNDLIVQKALDGLSKRDTAGEKHKEFIVIQLNGLAQTDDRQALKEISRQLKLDQEMQQRQSTSFAEALHFLLNALKVGSKESLPIIMILDEFDLFAEHSKQALLYNLFDIAQSNQNPIAVVGMTCRLDTMDMLEKRVKSRFSHRVVYVYPTMSFLDFSTLAKQSLLLPELPAITHDTYRSKFNEHVNQMFDHETFITMLRRIFDLTKDIRQFYRICYLPISKLSNARPFLTVDDFYVSSLQQRSDPKTELLKGVSLLELCLIIAMKKLIEQDIITFNFEMIYDEYKTFLEQALIRGQGVGMKLYKKAVALKAFEHLQSFELIRPVENVVRCPKEYRMMKIMLDPSQITDAVLKYRDCPTMVRNWGSQ